jgi:hypothetical protein
MQPPLPESFTQIVTSKETPSSSPVGQANDTKSIGGIRQLSLDDLPAEIVDEIAKYLRIQQRMIYFNHCSCDGKKRRHDSPLESLDLSTTPFETWSDPSWAFSCVSKRYRAIVFDGNKARSYKLGYSTCCVKRALAIPDYIRASVS